MQKTGKEKHSARARRAIGEFLIALGLLTLFATQVLAIFPESSVLAICGLTSLAIGSLMVALRARKLTLLLPEVLMCFGMALLAAGLFLHFHRYLLISAGVLLLVTAGILALGRKRQQQNSANPESDVRN
jgi:hypothetical protein